MPSTKTTILIDTALFKEMDRLAKLKRMPRSRLIARAIREFLRREQSAELTRSLDRSLAGGPADKDRAFLRMAAGDLFRRFKPDKW